MRKIDYIGKRFGRLLVIEEVDKTYTVKNPNGFRRFLCKCDCGKKSVHYSKLLGKQTFSCGCLHKELKTKTGVLTGTKKVPPIYNTRRNMKARCTNTKNVRYTDYGGRGITYDPRREQFENFYEDMKEGREKGLSIDRIDNNGNYYKENCRWVDMKVQARNRNNNVIYDGKCVAEWAEIWGVSRCKANRRISKICQG